MTATTHFSVNSQGFRTYDFKNMGTLEKHQARKFMDGELKKADVLASAIFTLAISYFVGVLTSVVTPLSLYLIVPVAVFLLVAFHHTSNMVECYKAQLLRLDLVVLKDSLDENSRWKLPLFN